MNALVISILTPILLLVLFSSNRIAAIAFLSGTLFLTQGQNFDIAGININGLRLIEIFTFSRVIIKKELFTIRLNKIDKALVAVFLSNTIIFLLRSDTGQAFTIGLGVDMVLCYFSFRALLRNEADLIYTLKAFAFLLIPFLGLTYIERYTGGSNIFSSMGGIVEGKFIREGTPRCMGSFRHPSLLGTLGATFIPIYIGLFFNKAHRKMAIIGMASSTGIVILSNSGGPLSSALFAAVCWTLWLFKEHLGKVRMAGFFLLIILALVMKAPIWYLFARVSSITGGDGWHRSYLIDRAILDLDKWWLAGMPITDTASWFPYIHQLTGGADMTNYFLFFGVTSGILTVILFIVFLYQVFSFNGRSLRDSRLSKSDSSNTTEYLTWGIGAAHAVHIINWQGITYFDQTYALWYFQVAAVTCVAPLLQKSKRSPL